MMNIFKDDQLILQGHASTVQTDSSRDADDTASTVKLSHENLGGNFAKVVGMISPDLGFFVNREALEDNKFIKPEYIEMDEEETTALAQVSFNNYTEELKRNGVGHEIFHQSTKAADSIFPDWFTTARNPFLPDGVLIISSMKTLERRKERMPELIDELSKRYADFIDLSPFENDEMFLELKGALVTDWENAKIYCNISLRAHEEVFDFMIEALNKIAAKTGTQSIRGIKFRSFDGNGEAIYHTD